MSLNTDSPWLRAFLIFCGGLLSLLVTPPLQVPDTPSHFLRAFQISEGQWVAQKREGITGGMLPVVLAGDADQWADLPFVPDRSISPAHWQRRHARSPRLTPEALAQRDLLQIAMIGLYSPVAYLPQALGIRLARALRLRNVEAMYLAGLCALLASTALLYLAFRILDFSRRAGNFCFLLAGMPMSLFLIGSPSADGITISLAILVLALALRLRRSFTPRLFACLLAAVALLGLCKYLYVLMALAAIPVALPGLLHKEGIRSRLAKAALLASVAVAPALLWGLANRGLWTPPRPGQIDPDAQMQYVLHHLPEFLEILLRVLVADHRPLVAGFVGTLGWLDTQLPAWLIYAYLLVLLVALVLDSKQEGEAVQVDLTTGIGVAAGLLAFLLAIALGTYLTWNEVGAPWLEGLQGRYFIPPAPFALLLIPRVTRIEPANERRLGLAILGAYLLSTVTMVVTLYSRYWIPCS